MITFSELLPELQSPTFSFSSVHSGELKLDRFKLILLFKPYLSDDDNKLLQNYLLKYFKSTKTKSLAAEYIKHHALLQLTAFGSSLPLPAQSELLPTLIRQHLFQPYYFRCRKK